MKRTSHPRRRTVDEARSRPSRSIRPDCRCLFACTAITTADAAHGRPPTAAPASSPKAIAAGTTRCPPRPFDAAAPLGPEFDEDVFPGDESKTIATEFLAGLATIYSDPSADVCQYFTEQGWTTALAHDPRLGAVARGESLVSKEHLLRVAFEGVYELRAQPPVVPLDIIFDVPAGAETKDVRSGETRTSDSTVREGFHADFLFDGHRWRVDRLGPVVEDYQAWTTLPSMPPPGPKCPKVAHDTKDSPFDEDADRQWCDAAGRGRAIAPDQLVMLTRYPCHTGHAAILHIGRPLGTTLDQLLRREYVRDPANEFLEQQWVTERFDGSAKLPKDAADSGWTNGNVDLWISPSDLDRAVYLVRNGTVERWPRAADGWGVIDCN